MDKDQDLFIKHCKDTLQNYHEHQKKAKEAYKAAFDNEPLEYKKNNAGIIAGNQYMLKKLKEYGAENWRPEKATGKPKPKNYTATGAPTNSGVKPMKPLPKGMKGIQL
jgi:hypothetical protein